MHSLDPYEVFPKEMQELISWQAFIDSSGLEESLIELLRVHVSQLNGCTRGVRRHSRRAWLRGESSARLAALAAWEDSVVFSEKERAALGWSEAVTFASWSGVPDALRAAIRSSFTDIEIVKLTLLVAATTAWNHVEMSVSQLDPRPLSGAS